MARRFSSRLLTLASALVPLVAAAQLERPETDGAIGLGDETGSFWASPESSDEPIDVQFRGLDLERAVRFLTGDESNVIADGTVGRAMSADLRRVQPAAALDMLLQREGLAARFEGNTVFLSAKETRVYPLPLVVKKESELWDELRTGIDDLRSTESVAALSKSGGILSIEDTPEKLDRVERHLHEVIASLLRQVEIEAKILEVVFEDNQGAGLDWALFDGILESSWGVVGGASGGLVGLQSVTDQREVFQIGLLKPDKWQAFIDGFDEEITLNMISRPRITAMSNQPATFEVREKIPYLTKTVSQEGGVISTEFELVFDQAGVKLDVTAFVSEGGVITLEVHPVISSVVGFTQSLPDLGPQPIIDSRETHSTVRIPAGYSLVMSGLMQDRKNQTTLGVPILSKIPFVGRAFRYEQHRTDKTEIVIVLTPHLRQDPAVNTLAADDRVRSTEFSLGRAGVPEKLAAARMERAWTRLVSGDRVGALGMVQSAARVVPSAWWTLNNLGIAQRETGYLAEAEASFRAAIRSQDAMPEVALVNLGTLLLHRGRPDEAIPVLEAARRADDRAVRDEASLGLALALERAGRTTDAIEALEGLGGESGRLGPRIRPRMERLLTRSAAAADTAAEGLPN